MKTPGDKSSERKSSAYTIVIKERALKELKKLPHHVLTKIDEKIQQLALNPRPAGCVKLEGYSNVYRIRHSDYRVVYSVQDSILTIEIIHIGNRKDIYRQL